MSGRSKRSFTWEDDLDDSYNEFTWEDDLDDSFKEFVKSFARPVISTRQFGIPKGRLLSETGAGDDEDGQRGRNRPSNASVEDSRTDSVNQIGSAIKDEIDGLTDTSYHYSLQIGKGIRTDRQNLIAKDIHINLIAKDIHIRETTFTFKDAMDGLTDPYYEYDLQIRKGIRIEDSSTDSVNQIESAIRGKAPQPPRPEKTPQSRRQSATGFITSIFKNKKQSATGFITSIFKNKKQMKMETFRRTDEDKPAGSDSFEPHPTNLGLARIFPYEELMEATNGFKQQVGEGGFSSVYLGKLRDKREVAVKVLYEGIKKRFEQFINEVTVLSRLRHPNLVSLYGCTDPETHKLLIVYEFVPNDTLANHLHGERPPLSWTLRIQIAIEIAMALAYLHSQVPPLIHRDVKSSNILLDNDFHPKLADFGMCRLVPWDTTYVSTLPQGTVGYRDLSTT